MGKNHMEELVRLIFMSLATSSIRTCTGVLLHRRLPHTLGHCGGQGEYRFALAYTGMTRCRKVVHSPYLLAGDGRKRHQRSLVRVPIQVRRLPAADGLRDLRQ